MMLSLRRRTQGFTLLEILIALSIFSILALMTSVLLHNALNSFEKTTAHNQQLAQLQLAIAIIQRDIETIIKRPVFDANGKLQPPVMGEMHDLEFTRVAANQLQRVKYYIHNHQFIRESSNDIDNKKKRPNIKQVLLTDVEQVRFEYLGFANAFVPYWRIVLHPEDPDIVSLPQAIQLYITLKQQGELILIYTVPSTVGYEDVWQIIT